MKFTVLAASALLAFAAAPAAAQDAADLSVGATVYGPAGAVVGTIKQVSGGAVVLDTGTNVATLATEGFVKGEHGTTIGYTKAQLDEAVETMKREQAAKLAAALVVGADLRSNDGVPVGTVQAINEDGSVVIDQDGRTFALQPAQLGTDASGLIVLFSAAQLEAALGGAAGG